jgi:apolipoprotein D and lipocalin family protein
MQKTLILATVALIGSVSAKYSSGQCTTPQLQENFDATKYVGTWFQVAKDKNSPFENGNCEQARYAINADGTLNVFNTQFNNETQQIEEANGTAWCNGPQCGVSFFWYSPKADYRVMYTDYENIALVYACNDLFLAKAEYAWILSREQHPSQDFVNKALATLAERVPDFTPDNFSWTYQGGACQYWAPTF